MAICYLGIGSNLGDRHKNIKSALKKVNALRDTEVIKTSTIIETRPVGGPPNQRDFLNGVLKIRTGLSPFMLLKNLKNIERNLGRKNSSVPNAPRTIDLDILFYSDKIINTKELKVPHSRIFEREFVKKPLLEVI